MTTDKLSGKLLLLSSDSPKSPTEIDGFTISANHRARVERTQDKQWYDSISVSYDSKSLDDIKKWVLFHSFVMESGITLDSYQDSVDGTTVYEKGKCERPQDYSDITGTVYFLHDPKNIKLSYSDYYKIFIKADDATIDAVKNMMIKFNPDRKNINSILDGSYWQLRAYYSVIESIIGRQPYCTGKALCSDCKKEFQHHSLSGKEWLAKRLNEIIGDKETEDQYLGYIWAVWQQIRNKTIHSSIHPTATYVKQEDDNVVYDLKKSLGDYDKDSTALFALKDGMGRIARYLLLDSIFELKIFPPIRPLQSTRIIITG